MTITPLGTAAPPKKCKIKTIAALMGGSAGGAMDTRNQEKAGNSARPGGPRQEPKGAVQAALVLRLPLPLRDQEPEKPKRRRDAISGMFWVSKKPRSAVAAARERGNVIAEANRAATEAISSAVVQDTAVDMDGGIGRVVDVKDEQKLRSCMLAARVHGLGWLRQASEVAVVDIALPSRRAKKPVKRDHHQIIEEVSTQIKRSCSASALAVCSAPSRGRRCRKMAKHSDGKTKIQPFMRLSPELQCLGLANVTPIISKILTSTDCNLNAHRLLLPREPILASPLMSMLTEEELKEVNRGGKEDGVRLELLDQHGRSYQMILKFLKSDKEYRLIGEWTTFVKCNGMCKGDLVDLWASRSDGRLLLMLLHQHHAMEGKNSEETRAAEAKEVEWVPEKTEAARCVGEEQTSADMEVAERVEEWTLDEMEAAEGLLALSHFKGGTKLEQILRGVMLLNF
ncbi:unnamed protein product [Urochloa decumbens]|uniref:TF-B3 domain-containing protein n=1 Tax=Urochloa decumbens TaxID=240449 RepID=A0ABC8VTV8_9POAL